MGDIKIKAKQMNILPGKMKKKELIQTIQQTEKNIVCYGTDRFASCEEYSCLWRSDCENPDS